MKKQHKFIVVSLLLSLGFVGINFLENSFRLAGVGGLSVLAVLLFAWALREGLGKNATLVTLILPSYFTLGVGLFWFLLPATILTWLPIVALYAFGIYFLCKTLNIFIVSAIRAIALVRAAKGVGFVLTLFTSFLLFDAILSIKTEIYVVPVLVFLASFPLYLQGLWSSKHEHKLDKSLLTDSFVFSYSGALISILLYFWPVSVIVGSLVLTVSVYVLLGLGQSKQERRLFQQTIREYLFIGFLVFGILFFFTNWRG